MGEEGARGARRKEVPGLSTAPPMVWFVSSGGSGAIDVPGTDLCDIKRRAHHQACPPLIEGILWVLNLNLAIPILHQFTILITGAGEIHCLIPIVIIKFTVSK